MGLLDVINGPKMHFSLTFFEVIVSIIFVDNYVTIYGMVPRSTMSAPPKTPTLTPGFREIRLHNHRYIPVGQIFDSPSSSFFLWSTKSSGSSR